MNKKILLATALMGSMVLAGCTPNAATEPGQQEGEQKIAVTGLTLDVESLALNPQGTHQLVATVTPDNATDRTVTYQSSNTQVASVTNSGLVTALANGTATITAKCGDITKTVTVTVTTPATGVTLDHETLEIEKGQTGTLVATVAPETASNKEITWSVEHENIASVNNGVVSALARGTTTVTATITGTSLSASATITVTEHFNITYTAYTGLNLTFPQKASAGDLVEVTASEAEAETYELAQLRIKANDTYLSYNQETGKYTFTMPSEDVVLTVESAPLVTAHTVTLYEEYDANILTVTGETWSSKKGHELTFKVTLVDSEHYELTTARLANPEQNPSTFNKETGELKFTMPNEDVRIIVEYHGKAFTVAFSNEEAANHYTLSNVSNGTAEYKSTVSVSYSVSDPYFAAHKFTGIKVNGGEVIPLTEGAYSISFTVLGNTTVEVVEEDLRTALVLTSSDHFNLAAYTKANDEYTLLTELHVLAGDKVYIKATSTANDEYALTGLEVTYPKNSAYSETGKINLLDGSHQEGDYYFFVAPTDVKKGEALTVTATEQATPYKDSEILGQYVGVYLNRLGTRQATSLEIRETGEVLVNNEVKTYVKSVETLVLGAFVTNAGGSAEDVAVLYNNSLLVGGYSLTSLYDKDTITVAYKIAEGKTASDYQVNVDRFESGKYVVIQVLEGETLLNAQLLVWEDETYRSKSNVALSFPGENKTILGNDARYDVTFEGGALYVYSKEDGSRGLLDGLQGTYAKTGESEINSIVVDGKGGVVFDNEAETRTYTYEGNVLTVVEDTDEATITYAFTLSENTFALVKNVEEKQPQAGPAFVGKSYYYTGSTYTTTITFTSETTCNINAKSSKKNKNYTGTVTYNEETNLVTIVIDTNLDYYTGTISFTYEAEQNRFLLKSSGGDWKEVFGITYSSSQDKYFRVVA